MVSSTHIYSTHSTRCVLREVTYGIICVGVLITTMHVCMYVCLRACARACVRACVGACVLVCLCVCLCVCVCVCVCAFVCACMCVSAECVRVGACVHVWCVCPRECARVYVGTCDAFEIALAMFSYRRSPMAIATYIRRTPQ